jgi:hypothetical protein
VDGDVEYGAHLPLIDQAAGRSLPALKAYVRAAAALGFRYLCANDHLLFSRPWLDGLDRLAGELRLVGRPPESCSNAIATTWLYITEDRGVAERALTDILAPMLNRPDAALRSLPLPIGPAEVCAERLTAFVRAAARRIFVWPLGHEVTQLELFRERVVPLVPRQP